MYFFACNPFYPVLSLAIEHQQEEETMKQETVKCGECGGDITPKMDKCYRQVKGEMKPVHRACQGGSK